MILFIDLEHRRLARDKPDYYARVEERRQTATARFAKLGQTRCERIPYTDISGRTRFQEAIDLIIVSGHNTELAHYDPADLERLVALFREPPCFVFTICGSFQLMAQSFGARIGPMAPAPKALVEDPILPADRTVENGFCPVRVESSSNGLFGGLPEELRVFQHHYWEVKDVPPGFRLEASSSVCPIQALTHESMPLAGVQFHPEDYDDCHPDGQQVLARAMARGLA